MKRKIIYALCVLYIISPIDLIPDCIPVIGWLDDLAVLLYMIQTYRSYADQLAAQLSPTRDVQPYVIEAPPTKVRMV
jgi:uncharacterized membrane protein YkvA (DUF1232 family)